MRPILVLTLVFTLGLGLLATAQLSGGYTLDPKKPASQTNFQSFNALFVSLNLSGVSGPITVRIKPGNYTDQITLRPIAGASSKNTISFEADNGLVSIAPPAWAQGTVLTNLKDAAWFRFVGIYITGFIYRGVSFQRAHDIAFINCTIDDGFHTLPNVYSLYLDACRNITLHGCSIRSAGGPLHATGITTGCQVVGCDLDGKGKAGYVASFNRGTNTFDYDHLLEANYIHDCGPTGVGLHFGDKVGGNLILNNTIVVDTAGSAIEVGFTQQGTWDWKTANVLRNNILVNHGNGSAAHYQGHLTSRKICQIDADHNGFFAPNSKRTILVGPISHPVFAGTLQLFQVALSVPNVILHAGGPARIDVNSIEGAPQFKRATKPYDVHLLPTSPLLDRGTPAPVPSYVTFPARPVGPDYEGQQRDPNPDIGADEEYVEIQGTSTVKVGGSTIGAIYAANDAGFPYRAATSLGKGPQPIDFRRIELTLDPILLASIQGALPGTFKRYAGLLDTGGRGTISLVIPNIPALKGTSLHTAFMTFDGSAPSGIRSISPTWSVLIN